MAVFIWYGSVDARVKISSVLGGGASFLIASWTIVIWDVEPVTSNCSLTVSYWTDAPGVSLKRFSMEFSRELPSTP